MHSLIKLTQVTTLCLSMDLVNYSARAQNFLYFRPSFSTWIICSFLFLFIDSAVKPNKKLCYCSLTCKKEWREILWPVKWSTFLEEWLFWQSHLQWILLRYDNIATCWYFLGIFTLMYSYLRWLNESHYR